jgi:hypothetical protein
LATVCDDAAGAHVKIDRSDIDAAPASSAAKRPCGRDRVRNSPFSDIRVRNEEISKR